MRGRVLVVDDDHEMCAVLEADLSRRQFGAASRTSGDAALDTLYAEDFDVVVTDLNMRGMNGIDLCERIRTNRPDIPVIVITAFGSFDTAVAAIRAGAYDFITKPFDIEGLALALDRAVQHRMLTDEVRRLRQVVSAARGSRELLGESTAMRKLLDLVARVADSEAAVLITGETGTGKELVARSLHRLSRRSDGPFVAIDGAAVPESLLESQLFGHAKGAYTDAREERHGLFAEADGGTLFLDEIGNMPVGLQPKLLRAIQERRARPVGGGKELPFNVRIVAATNSDLETAVDEGRFRKDLYFRLNVIHLEVPPLRARANDVLLLAQHFVEQFATRSGKHVQGLSTAAAAKLLAYEWPGNVRELQNCMERAVALANFEQIAVDDLPERIRSYTPGYALLASDDPSELSTLEEVEQRYILRVLSAVGGSKSMAARILGVDRKTLYRRLERYLPPSRDD